MPPEPPLDEALPQRLPLPLAQLYRRAHNAKTALDRHLTAFYLWEASLKLLGCTAVVAYAARPEHDPKIAEKLQSLARALTRPLVGLRPHAAARPGRRQRARLCVAARVGRGPHARRLPARRRPGRGPAPGAGGPGQRSRHRAVHGTVRPAGALPQPGDRPRRRRPAPRRLLRAHGVRPARRRGRGARPPRRAGRAAPAVCRHCGAEGRHLAGAALRIDRRVGPPPRGAGAAARGGRPTAGRRAGLPGRPGRRRTGRLDGAAPAAAVRRRRRRGAVPQRPPGQAAHRLPRLLQRPLRRGRRPGRRAACPAGPRAGHGGGRGAGGALGNPLAGRGAPRGNPGRAGAAHAGRVRAAQRAGPGRHGRGLPRLAAVTRPAGGPEKAAARRRPDRGPLPPRDPSLGEGRAPAPGADLHVGVGRRPVVLRDGTGRRGAAVGRL